MNERILFVHTFNKAFTFRGFGVYCISGEITAFSALIYLCALLSVQIYLVKNLCKLDLDLEKN